MSPRLGSEWTRFQPAVREPSMMASHSSVAFGPLFLLCPLLMLTMRFVPLFAAHLLCLVVVVMALYGVEHDPPHHCRSPGMSKR